MREGEGGTVQEEVLYMQEVLYTYRMCRRYKRYNGEEGRAGEGRAGQGRVGSHEVAAGSTYPYLTILRPLVVIDELSSTNSTR